MLLVASKWHLNKSELKSLPCEDTDVFLFYCYRNLCAHTSHIQDSLSDAWWTCISKYITTSISMSNYKWKYVTYKLAICSENNIILVEGACNHVKLLCYYFSFSTYGSTMLQIHLLAVHHKGEEYFHGWGHTYAHTYECSICVCSCMGKQSPIKHWAHINYNEI